MQTPETTEHILLFCPWTSKIWSHHRIQLHHAVYNRNRIEEWLQEVFETQSGLPSKEIIAFILWHIWKAHSHFTFRRQRTTPDQLVDVALAEETLYRHSLQQLAIPESPLLNPNRLWTLPDHGSFKANIDGTFTPNSNSGAIACVFRDPAGILIDGFSRTVRASSPCNVKLKP